MGSPGHRLRCCASIFAPPALSAALLLVLISLLSSRLPVSQAQTASDSCNGIFLSYVHSSRTALRPRNLTPQPYAFRATATISNFDSVPLKSWAFHVGLPNGTILVSVSSAVLTDGSSLPAVVGPDGASFSGNPVTDLKTAIETAGDLTQMQVSINIVGTQFGAEFMPGSLSLGSRNDYICPAATRPPGTNTSLTCCVRDPNFRSNDSSSPLDTEFLPRREGDLTISYDVTQSSPSDYLALVTIANGSPLGRLDNWRLTWEWMRGEFIRSMQGAYPSTFSSSECVFGPQGQFYQQLDFSEVVNCARSPTILDLPLSKANDTAEGRIPFCCRNGTILPAIMDSGNSAASAFQLQVYKMPPDLNRTVLFPPQNWRITGAPGALNPSYVCSPPVRVRPTQFPDTSGLQSSTSAIASWQVVCNITRPRGSSPRCCVSFSAFYNESAVPCKTCACGCPSSSSAACSATSPALLLPSEALLVPFENRTAMARAWAELKHFGVPNPMPCGDFCGVSINWHVSTDYRNGWSARMTLFNWEDASLPDWFAAVRLDEAAYAGYEAMYSFNGTTVGNNTIFIEGLSGLNYLMGETPGENPEKDPRVPGKQQSVISFTKKTTPGFDMLKGHGFPTKVIFNGEECSLPDVFPANRGHRAAMADRVWSLAIVFAVTLKILLDR